MPDNKDTDVDQLPAFALPQRVRDDRKNKKKRTRTSSVTGGGKAEDALCEHRWEKPEYKFECTQLDNLYEMSSSYVLIICSNILNACFESVYKACFMQAVQRKYFFCLCFFTDNVFPAFLIIDLDHTADIQIHAWGRDLAQAFEHAGHAMYNYMVPLDEIAVNCNVPETRITVSGHDEQSLLYNFMQELLFDFHTSFRVCWCDNKHDFNAEHDD